MAKQGTKLLLPLMSKKVFLFKKIFFPVRTLASVLAPCTWAARRMPPAVVGTTMTMMMMELHPWRPWDLESSHCWWPWRPFCAEHRRPSHILKFQSTDVKLWRCSINKISSLSQKILVFVCSKTNYSSICGSLHWGSFLLCFRELYTHSHR